MDWEDLLQEKDTRLVAVWLGGRHVNTHTRVLHIRGHKPTTYGWYEWKLFARHVELIGPAEPVLDEQLPSRTVQEGYLVGDHFAPDTIAVQIMTTEIAALLDRVHLIPDGIERFTRVKVGRVWSAGELIFCAESMPVGPEPEVLQAYYDRKWSLNHIKGVTPALDVAFRAEVFQRAEAEQRRAELEKRECEEAAKRVIEEQRQNLIKQLGDGAGRREMARVDFLTAARAALAVGGAELLDWRHGISRREYVVTYRVEHERLQCVVDETMHVIDAGVCLTDHRTGRKGDQLFTLESLPGVIREAIRDDKLVKWRHG